MRLSHCARQTSQKEERYLDWPGGVIRRRKAADVAEQQLQASVLTTSSRPVGVTPCCITPGSQCFSFANEETAQLGSQASADLTRPEGTSSGSFPPCVSSSVNSYWTKATRTGLTTSLVCQSKNSVVKDAEKGSQQSGHTGKKR